jgi:peptidoglycan/xylan/chitin deacetylase (PgdA/CDA1 family)
LLERLAMLIKGDFAKVAQKVPRGFRRALRSTRIRMFPPKPKPLILMYHSIADELVDPWGLAVSPAHFKEHLDVLRRTRQPLPLTDFVGNLVAGTLSTHAVAVTFDDGYVDNLVAGKPLLAAANVPATVFLATGYLGRANDFWWDELATLILIGAGPRNLEITIRGQTLRFDLRDDIAVRSNDWRVWVDSPRTVRQEAYLAIWKALRAVGMHEREAVMAKLHSALGSSPERARSRRPMTPQEVRALVRDRLVAIGAHTVTHPLLSGLGAAACHREIAESKLACEAIVGAPVLAFAYPYGDMDPRAREAVKAAGFILACSTLDGPTIATSDVFALPRIHVPSIDGDAFEKVLHLASAVS